MKGLYERFNTVASEDHIALLTDMGTVIAEQAVKHPEYAPSEEKNRMAERQYTEEQIKGTAEGLNINQREWYINAEGEEDITLRTENTKHYNMGEAGIRP